METINKILLEVNNSNKVNHKDAYARINSANLLVKNTHKSFEHLKQILPSDNTHYQLVADKLGMEILQCSIDYYNNSSDAGNIDITIGRIKYAQSIVASDLAKQRCKENLDALVNIKNLPPLEITAEVDAIVTEFQSLEAKPNNITNATVFLVNIDPYLCRVGQKIGIMNPYYLHLSTQIARKSFKYIIDEVNAIVKSPNIIACSELGTGLDYSSILLIKDILCKAVNALTLLDGYYMEQNFIEEYEMKRDALLQMYHIIRKESMKVETLSIDQSIKSLRNRSSVYDGCIIGIVIMFVMGFLCAFLFGYSGFFLGIFFGGLIGIGVYKFMEDN